MDWYLADGDVEAAPRLRAELARYLRRHCADGSDVDGALLVATELVANAVRHAPGPTWVHVGWSGEAPELEVHDLGPGFVPDFAMPADPLTPGGRGLAISAAIAQELDVAAKRAGGSRVRAVLPVRRARQASYPARPRPTPALPVADEARPDGTFGREAFLRALVVQLAEVVEAHEGPAAAEAAVTQVGTDVGGRMEAAYRRARGIVERLEPEQIGDLYVRLKGAIGGDFYVVEADEQRIVLGNRRCPFGDVVQRAPGLCRMTSSVFGGIAARNAGGAAVVLEERIAVGDPECRVVVWLGARRAGDSPAAHHYVVD